MLAIGVTLWQRIVNALSGTDLLLEDGTGLLLEDGTALQVD